MTARRPPCLKCARLGVTGADLFAHATGEHDALLAEREAAEEGERTRALAAAQKTATPEATRGGCVNQGSAAARRGGNDPHPLPSRDGLGTPSLTGAPDQPGFNYAPASPTTTAPATQARVAWATVAQVSAANDAPSAIITIDRPAFMGPPPSERWTRWMDDAAALGPGLHGSLLAVEARCITAKMHALDPQWRWHFGEFYASGKMVDIGRFGVRAAKSDSTMYALLAEVLLLQRNLQEGVIGVCPVMSANMREAGGRVETAKSILRACGFQDISGTKASVEPFQFKSSGGGNSAHVIELIDSQDHAVEIRVYPASEAGAAGFTGIAGFGDELDLWGKQDGANPAEKTIRVLASRYTTQPEAKLHLMSATYDRKSEHAKMIANGDTVRQRVARIGVAGAALDYRMRLDLAARIMSTDPLLIGPPLDPMCTDIPCWVSNPVATIWDCYEKLDGDLRVMFGLNGGRLGVGGRGGMSLEDARAIVEMNRDLARPLDDRMRSADGLFDYGPADDTRHRGL